MIARMIATALVFALVGGTASAGTLKGGVWEPTGCGLQPMAPAINPSSVAAYQDSVKAAQAYQTAANAYNQCVFKEAEADNGAISSALHDEQTGLQASFDKLAADSKAAATKLNGKK